MNNDPFFLKWVPAQDGAVPACAIAAGHEKGNPNFVGRCSLKGGQKYVGRIVPADRSCYVICTCMEHRRSCYEALVNPTSRTLCWRKDFGGHVPDTAVAFEEGYYVGRAEIPEEETAEGMEPAVVPGSIVPAHGVLHCGYDNREVVVSDYETLCLNAPCSLKYLAAKRIRDCVRERERAHNAKYLTKISNLIQSLERIFLSILRREQRRRESSEDKLAAELPLTLIRYLRSPKLSKLPATPHLDFNTIVANCCPPEDNCICQMWVEVTLQGLY